MNVAAGTMLITPQSVSIALGAVLIIVMSYRLPLLVVAAVSEVFAAWLVAWPVPGLAKTT